MLFILSYRSFAGPSKRSYHFLIGLRDGRAFQYAAGKQFWKHNGFLPLRNDTGGTEIDTFIKRYYFLIGLRDGRAFQYAAGKQADDLNSQTYCIPRISFNFSPFGSDWTVSRNQFPLCLVYVDYSIQFPHPICTSEGIPTLV
ncbi:hypothetical protein L210DRAFT_3541230 [Boletus edulis BED1]|uniref:Uncharacterized protein n=1 Tax=Boletus edulis BED1 TaxID=1328754 RepID=A0AAD4BUQ3_BOLED|nr:hypothetical protein L210DRAFT_3541230 [Boletus edulis BED1]